MKHMFIDYIGIYALHYSRESLQMSFKLHDGEKLCGNFRYNLGE